MKSLTSWLEYLGKLHPKEIDLGLERVASVAHRLNLLPVPYKTIIVGGTNGKGTTCHLLESIYRCAGYKTGLATSPHLLTFNERIVVNGEMASDHAIVDAFSQIEHARAEISLSYFEFSLLASLIIFHKQKIDIAILEVGLGGRLDAVNIVDADVAVITTIDFDHMQWLGNSRELIAYEKAGIFRSLKPAVIGDVNVPQSAIGFANSLNARVYRQAIDFSYKLNKASWEWKTKDLSLTHLPLPQIPIQNASTALMAITCMNTLLPVNDKHIIQALSQLKVPGRFQVVNKHCPIILDVAHNPQSAKLLAENLDKHPCQGRTFAVFSALADKDIAGIIAPLTQNIDLWFYAGLDAARASSLEQLTTCLEGLTKQKYASIELAYQAALCSANKDDRIVVFGSFFVVAAILKEL
jgi:dihydrofolate synthase/folylpolyglutamate synthase